MFDFFMGTPLVISIVAPFTAIKSLKEICIDLWNKKKEREDAIGSSAIHEEMQYEALLDSLDYCTKYF